MFRFPQKLCYHLACVVDPQALKSTKHEMELTLQLIDQDGDEDSDEYEWVTDTDEEYPEYQCDVCGRVMSNDCERFHCHICEDYDLVGS